jgi:hypothetical protein
MNQPRNTQLKSTADRFMRLFSGRADCWGALYGECIRQPVTQKSYFLHLIGKASLGIYPLFDDGTCRFASVDIDRDDRELVLRVREELWNVGLKRVFIERSKSKGYHLWVFFSEALRASDVRWIINSALEKLGARYEVFPKQDYLREGEIGNYINLPYFQGLQWTPGRRVVVDSKTFEPISLEKFLDEAEHSLVDPEELALMLEGLPPIPKRLSTALERPAEIPNVDVEKLQVSERVSRLILGDFTRGEYEAIEITDPATGEIVRYPSRSEADEAIISALLGRGYGDKVIFGVFEKYPTTGKYKEKGGRKDQYIIKSIENAKRFIGERREEKAASFSSKPFSNPKMNIPTEKNEKEKMKGRGFTLHTPSTVLSDGRIVEMIYDPVAKETKFAVFREEVTYKKSIILEDSTTLFPYSPKNNLIKNEVVLFPSKTEEYGSEEELIGGIKEFIHSYVDLSPLFENISSYYVLFSWIYDDFRELPYLRVIGDTGSGKTRFLLTVGSLCYKPIFASGASTVSPIFRILDIFHGTLIIDEGDFRMSDEKAEIVKILNNGNAKGFPVLRSETVKGKEFNPKGYNVFGPKLVATRGYFQDNALESRCITEEMGQRRLREDIPINLTDEHKEKALQLRNKLLMFRFRNFGKRDINPGLAIEGIEARLNQIFIPLLSVIEDENARSELKNVAREYHRQLVLNRGMEAEGEVLEIIQKLFGMMEEPTIKEITSHFVEHHGNDYEKRITPKWIGSVIRRKLKIKTEKRMEGFVIPGSELHKLERLYEKYGISETDKNQDRSNTFEEPRL